MILKSLPAQSKILLGVFLSASCLKFLPAQAKSLLGFFLSASCLKFLPAQAKSLLGFHFIRFVPQIPAHASEK
ncbi:MAG: hypothetical protein FWE78_05170 [Methanimicrococcus sp.]|nr:hypothetical protein [Methanimicrococcus sp.]